MPRSLRRHHLARIKRKYAKVWMRWHGRRSDQAEMMIKSSRWNNGVHIVARYTARELQTIFGTLAAQHATHICGMCHAAKIYDVPKIKASESSRIYDLTSD